MESERLNRWLTLGANLGVLIGILLLVFELNQNRDLVRAQIRNELSQGVIDILRLRTDNEQLADILFRAENGEELSPLESSRYMHFYRAFFRYVANVHYQYRQGLYDDSEYGLRSLHCADGHHAPHAHVDIHRDSPNRTWRPGEYRPWGAAFHRFTKTPLLRHSVKGSGLSHWSIR